MSAVALEASQWQAINDTVMGGLSRAEIVATQDGLRFQGTLSRENGGGFASARKPIECDLRGARAVRIRVRGDGRRYQLRFRMDDNFDGIAWRAAFKADESWQSFVLPFADFRPVFRGTPVPDAGELEAARIRQAGLLLSDGPEGEFSMDLSSMEWLGERQHR